MSEFKRSSKLPARKTIRSKMVDRVREMGNDSLNAAEKFGEHEIGAEKIESIKWSQSSAIGECLSDKRPRSPKKIGTVQNTRTAPNGKRSVVSDGAIESMAAEMEKRTNIAIRKIGRSIGF